MKGVRASAGLVGRLVVAVGAALLVVAVGSRVNRAGPLRVVREWPGVADVVLGEVDVGSVERIGRAAPPGRVRVDWGTLGATVQRELRNADAAAGPHPLREVRLGTAMALWARGTGERQLEGRIEDGVIVIGGAGTAAATGLEERVYDVRDVRADVESWMAGLGPIAAARPLGGGGLFGGGGGVGGPGVSGPVVGSAPAAPLPPPTVAVRPVYCAAGEELAALVRETVFVDQWFESGGTWRAQGWAGWLHVRATAEGHRAVERFLMLIRCGDSAKAAGWGKGARS